VNALYREIEGDPQLSSWSWRYSLVKSKLGDITAAANFVNMIPSLLLILTLKLRDEFEGSVMDL
jgi:hypothetical protein